MKLSLKFRGDDGDQHSTTQTQIMTAKVPVTVFNNPFISGITATTTTNSSSDFAFSLSTDFPSGPTLKLSYSPTASLPFSLSLKSGLGIFGSPRHSPLVFSANFSLSLSPSTHTHTLTPLPSFFLHFKPQFGHFSLHKTVFSDPVNTHHHHPLSPPDSPHIGNEMGFVNVAGGSSSASGWQDLKLEPHGGDRDHSNDVVVPERSLVLKNGAQCGVAVMARTVMPVTQGLLLNFRWGVNFPGNLGLKMPYLTVNKIGLERVREVKQNKGKPETSSDSDLQLLKGVCFSMRRDLESVEEENRKMKRVLDDMKMGVSTGNYSNGDVGKKHFSSESSGEFHFQRWGSNRNGRQENEKKQPNKSQSVATDLESELQKAIKAAASS